MSSFKNFAMKTAGIILCLLVFSLPAEAIETAPVQDQGGINTAELRLLLNSFGALGEGHIESVLRGLRIISVTEEARSGEWEKMKGVLAEFDRSGIKAAVVWFALPDGSYYSLEKGLTGLNLRYREYFPRLMAGEEIIGDLVLSTSTGKRTAIVAVPIKKDGKIIGALGTSLEVEEISRMLDEKMGLPDNIFFYALDQKGQSSLHRKSALLFAYPSDMGSKSLAKSVGEMLSMPEGVVTYDFYGARTVVYKKFPLTGWVFAIGIVTGKPGEPVAELPPILSELEKEITSELNKMDQDLARLAGRLSEKDFKTAGTRKMLGDLCRSYAYAVDCAVVDRNGMMMLVEPEEYAKFEGSDISSQEQIVRLRESKKPVMSNVIRTVEGIVAVDLEHPLFSSNGELAGSVSVLIKPETMLASIISPVVQGTPVDVWLMQKDGRILYDPDEEEVGLMLFDDPLYKPYPQLLALGTLIARERSGTGSYEFLGKGLEKPVMKDAYWTTVGLHGTEWRLVAIHVRAGHALSSGKELEKPVTVSHDDSLRTLAENTEMKKALSEKDGSMILDIFKDFYSEHEGLYSIQWLDSRGINRLGYPEENSLINLDMKSLKTASSKPMLRALANKKESSFDSPLVEGKTGMFFMVPVFEGRNYLGMIYTIRLK
ncbi:MAG: cache domain-containing protein [Nitrospirae bacterium]|nr:cache domain-containing protein [Nitrospirota bacterium]